MRVIRSRAEAAIAAVLLAVAAPAVAAAAPSVGATPRGEEVPLSAGAAPGAPVFVPNGQSLLYVVNNDGNSITEYAPGASGNSAPGATIAGAATGLAAPRGIAVSSSRTVYITNDASNSITVYAPGSNGDATPTATIAGPATGLSDPLGIALDPRR